MAPSVIAKRWELAAQVGVGGMGTVYRARDVESGQTVAVKVMRGRDPRFLEWSVREARALLELSHPHVVRYVAHGELATGEAFLVTEWLDGESLSARLKRDRLTLAEVVTLGRCAAQALAAAHARGIVHRDVKPGNLFLVDGQVARLKLLDFGVAHRLTAGRDDGSDGAVIGTVGYMAPEQARGEPVDARADVFALGCILYRGLANRAPFAGPDSVSTMLKLVLDEPPRLDTLRDDVDPALAALVHRMLAKAPDARPPDGAAVAEALAALDAPHRESAPPVADVPPAASALTGVERRVLCIVVARLGRSGSADETLPVAAEHRREEAMGRIAAEFGGSLLLLADETVVVSLAGPGDVTERAVRAGRCALALRAEIRAKPIALVAGRAVLAGRLPAGDVIDRAAVLLQDEASGVRIDASTAEFLSRRFDVEHDAAGIRLVGERDADDAAPTLLGRAMPCVGRDRELAALDAVFDACTRGAEARAVVVTAPAGVGKSRLRQQFLRRLHERNRPVEVWLGRGDPMTVGSPFALLARALRGAMAVRDGESPAEQQRKVRARVDRYVPPARRDRVAEFLGELAGVPFAGDASVQLAAARNDAVLLGDQMRRAFEDFVTAETRARPVVLVLEDLHWGDPPTVTFVDAALRAAARRPFMVLALAHPGVHPLFPRPSSPRGTTELELEPLDAEACATLARAALGDAASDAVVRAVVDRSGGNALYLEEGIRAAASGRDDALSETVVAMVEGRLAALDPERRRTLRAASVFGQTFWRAGVAALLGREAPAEDLGAQLDQLARDEVVRAREPARFPGEDEYGFRHALLRDAAYATLTAGDRALGHRLAGAWLERAGERDPMALALHFERGAEPRRAAPYYLVAAREALAGNDFEAAAARAEAGVTAGALGADLGRLRAIQARAHLWRAEHAATERAARAAVAELPAGGVEWFHAVGDGIYAAARLGRDDALADWIARLRDAHPAPDARAVAALTAVRAAVPLFMSGRHDLGDAMLRDAEAALADAPADDPTLVARLHMARAWQRYAAGDVGGYYEHYVPAVAAYEAAGDERTASQVRINMAYALTALGAYERAVALLREALAAAKRVGAPGTIALAKHNLGPALAGVGQLDEAAVVEADAAERYARQSDRRMEGMARAYLARILAAAGQLERAESEARRAVDLATGSHLGPGVLAVLASVLVLQGRAPEALAILATARADAAAHAGRLEGGELPLDRAYAEALLATGDAAGARAVAVAARDKLLAYAATITDPALRQSYLERVPDNARVLALADS